MESSRVFVRNLPPTITEADFRKHFSSDGNQITDVKLIPNRRIGFVGFASADAAAKALKLNRSYIRMSRISVSPAKPITDPNLRNSTSTPKADDTSKASAPAPAPLKGSSEPTKDDENVKKRKHDPPDEADPKFAEFLEVMDPGHRQKRQRSEEGAEGGHDLERVVPPEGDGSDEEYEDMPSQGSKRPPPETEASEKIHIAMESNFEDAAPQMAVARDVPQIRADADDNEWLRSRTNRLLDLIDPDDPGFASQANNATAQPPTSGEAKQISQKPGSATTEAQGDASVPQGQAQDTALELIRKTRRIYVRNLPYSATEDNIRDYFGAFGPLEEVHLPVDRNSKGFALVLYADSDDAISAFQEADGSIFMGRIIHILPGAAKRETSLDEFALSKLPLKKQNLLRKKAQAASSTFSWNSLFMSQDAVNAAVAQRLGMPKSEFLDPTSSENLAVKQAVAETQVIQEAKTYFAANGVDLDAFKSQQRGDAAILVKNLPHGALEEVKKLFEEIGPVKRVLSPPSGTIAIIEMAQVSGSKTAFSRLAYRRVKNSVLFLEKAPKNIFFADARVEHQPQAEGTPAGGQQKLSVSELLERGENDENVETTSLYVKNLSFETATPQLAEAFKALDGFMSALVKTKPDPKRPGEVLSMGFGFVEFKSKAQALAATKVMDGYSLDGHQLSVKASHRGLDAAEERRREDLTKKKAGQRTKIVIKNLPFEATRADVRRLFGTFGTLRAVRVPKKFNHSSRGFAFAEFVTPREAENAYLALKDTHLLGRKLVLDFAAAEEIDPEEEIAKMQKKIGGQVNKMTLQRLTGGGRTKIDIGDNDDDDV